MKIVKVTSKEELEKLEKIVNEKLELVCYGIYGSLVCGDLV